MYDSIHQIRPVVWDIVLRHMLSDAWGIKVIYVFKTSLASLPSSHCGIKMSSELQHMHVSTPQFDAVLGHI